MALRPANTIPAHLLMWQRVREYAVPPSMIETAAARRAVGDWAGACAAARIDVDFDLRAVRHRHGTSLASRVRADLRRLVPDLLRWHMPRTAPDGRLRDGLTLSLARYRGEGSPPLHLVVRTPPAQADFGQRMSLALWEGTGNGTPTHHPHPRPDRRFRLDLHRHLWDHERIGELARRCGADRVPSPARPAPSVSARPAPSVSARPAVPELPATADGSWAVANWAPEAELLLRAEGLPRGAFTVRLGTRSRAVLELVAPDDSHAPTLRQLRETLPPQEIAALPLLPEAASRVLPDLELLRAGLIAVDRLHPLVAAALAASDPVASDPVASDLVASDLVASPRTGPGAVPVSPAGDPHRVACRGEVHRIGLRDGVLTAIDHGAEQLRREALLVALGGPPLPCLRAIDEVHRAPEALPAVRERLGHGDVTGALAVVEGLLGPGAVLREGPPRDELESAVARRVDQGLFRSGLVAVHPGAGVAAGGRSADPRYPETGHRPRLDRRTPRAVRSKLSRRARPRTGMA
ncbi:hypothetical protein [Streptomyces sp. NPDC008125]|uniref:hypothetical protein n=1 Tax=Streptomyces sp. NPDC008125 TaxID=3364811 RepID=UPI0036E83FD0